MSRVDTLVLPLPNAHFIWYFAWLSIPSAIYAYTHTETTHFALIPTAVWATSILYWRNPISDSWRRTIVSSSTTHIAISVMRWSPVVPPVVSTSTTTKRTCSIGVVRISDVMKGACECTNMHIRRPFNRSGLSPYRRINGNVTSTSVSSAGSVPFFEDSDS